MKAAVLKGIRDLVIEEVLEPTSLAPGMVRVEVKAVGICGSDVHYYQEGAIGSFVLESPMILGHEVGGIVVATGEGVSIPVGAVVALEPGIPCQHCRHCKSGEYNLCPDVSFFATPPVDGAMTRYVDHPAEYTFLADGLTPDEASLAEPMSVGVYGVRKANIHLGDSVAIMGAGPVGLLTALAAESEGGRVQLFDVVKERVEFARRLGFEARLFGETGTEYDVVMDCSGNKNALEFAVGHVRRGGKLVLIGMGTKEGMQLSGLDLCLRGISVEGIFRYANTFPAAIELIRRHREKLAEFTKVHISLDELPDYLSTGRYKESLKTIVDI